MFWNNQPDREASSLVRKGVGRNTILRAVETPYPTVNPIQSKRYMSIVHPPYIVLRFRSCQIIENICIRRRAVGVGV